MKNFNFRVRIVGTIFLAVTFISLISFSVFNLLLKDRLLSSTEETFSQMNLLRDQYYFTISLHDGRIIRSMLKSAEKDTNVLKTYLVNHNSKVVYPENYSSLSTDTASFGKLYSQSKDISIKSYSNTPVPFQRVFIRMQNAPACYSCHNPTQQNLGMIVLDLANHETNGIIALTKRFSFYYTFFILITIFILVGYLHYRYISKSMRQFRYTITQINSGNLDVRLAIPEVRELGMLGKNFNEMVDTFEKAQIELQLYHQKELQHSEKLATIGEMSARIAHEIRNPVTGIARAMDIILAEKKDSGNQPIFEEIQRQANRVNQAISNLLKFSQTKDVKLEQGDINKVIQSLVFFLENQSHEKDINYQLDLSADIPEFLFDHELIENVILNISLNAIQASSEKVTIHFSSTYNLLERKVVISVRDYGNGIPEELGKDIFKPFFTTRTKGTGLGLAISKDIVNKHSGEIWYENNLHKGCTFFISLPA